MNDDRKYPAKPDAFGLHPRTRERIDGLATELRKPRAESPLFPVGRSSERTEEPEKQKPRR